MCGGFKLRADWEVAGGGTQLLARPNGVCVLPVPLGTMPPCPTLQQPSSRPKLRGRGLDVVCLDARHASAALKMQMNKTDQNGLM